MIPDSKWFNILSNNIPSSSKPLQSYLVTEQGKTWIVSFQLHWLQQLSLLHYNTEIDGGICCYCILFSEPLNRQRGGSQGTIPGVLVLSSYQELYTKVSVTLGLLCISMLQKRLTCSKQAILG